MPQLPSPPSPIITKAYLRKTNLFFDHSKLLYAQITELFDEVWFTDTACKYLQQQVTAYYHAHPHCTNQDLRNAFVDDRDITNRPNLFRIGIHTSLPDIEYKITKNLLINLFPFYEEWVHKMTRLLIHPYLTLPKKELHIYTQALQYSSLSPFKHTDKSYSYKDFLHIAKSTNSSVLYPLYSTYKKNNAHYDLHALDNWLLYYRYFKECRNCIIHNGGYVTKGLIQAYHAIQHITLDDLKISELPQIIPPTLNNPLQLSLRGVVGFSQFIFKLIATLDTEMILCEQAQQYLCNRIKNGCITIPSHTTHINEQTKSIRSLLKGNYFQCPPDPEAKNIYDFLVTKGIIR